MFNYKSYLSRCELIHMARRINPASVTQKVCLEHGVCSRQPSSDVKVAQLSVAQVCF